MKKILLFLGILISLNLNAQFKKLDVPILQNGQKIPLRTQQSTSTRVTPINTVGDTVNCQNLQIGSIVTTADGKIFVKMDGCFKEISNPMIDFNNLSNKPNLNQYVTSTNFNNIINTKENIINPSNATMYYRGDKSWSELIEIPVKDTRNTDTNERISN